jgi:hypothetical protein
MAKTFEKARAEVDQLVEGQLRLKRAHVAAVALVKDFPDRAEAWLMVNLVVTLSNRTPGVVEGTPRYIREAKKCAGFTDRLHGDMLRDQVIGIARFCHGNELANAEPIILQKVRKLHAGDKNRLACATDVQGRLRAAHGDYRKAIDLHSAADAEWVQLGKAADAGWVHRNLVEWLRSEVFLGGTHSKRARDLFERIEQGGGNMRRAKLIMRPGVGLYLDHMAITHR